MNSVPAALTLKNLKAWARITNQLYIWHYNTNYSHYLAPFPDFYGLAANISVYQRNGVVGLFLEGAYPPGGGSRMPNCVPTSRRGRCGTRRWR